MAPNVILLVITLDNRMSIQIPHTPKIRNNNVFYVLSKMALNVKVMLSNHLQISEFKRAETWNHLVSGAQC